MIPNLSHHAELMKGNSLNKGLRGIGLCWDKMVVGFREIMYYKTNQKLKKSLNTASFLNLSRSTITVS